MKKKKLDLNDLKVQSFVTSLENDKSNTVKGGTIGVDIEIDIIVGPKTNPVACPGDGSVGICRINTVFAKACGNTILDICL